MLQQQALPSICTPRYDLHCHTQYSDGLLTPEDIVVRAVKMQVTHLAITDHDTILALADARDAIVRLALPLELINGVEISTAWQHNDIHIVGLKFDATNNVLISLLNDQKRRRSLRAEEISKQLAKHQIKDALIGAQTMTDGTNITRAHFARYLVKLGLASTEAKIFKKYLAKGKIGYVPPQWCSIAQAVNAIHQAGGIAVLAHPHRYNLSNEWLSELFTYFKSVAGDAIEVGQCRQSPNQRSQLAREAEKYQFLASVGSDFHYPCAWTELGQGLQLPTLVTPVWQDW